MATMPTSIKKLSSPIPAKLPKEINQISKFFKNLKQALVNKTSGKLYAQASKPSNYTEDIIRIKETFSSLSASKIDQVQKIIKSRPKSKPYIQITTKSLSRKQIIVPMNGDNIMKFMKESNHYILNINKALRNIKSDVLVDFICSNLLSIIVVMCKVTSLSDLQVIKNYIKNVNCIDIISVDIPHLPQSKFYLKIIDIPYFQYDLSNHLILKDIEDIIKQNQIFNNIILMSKPYVIKMSLKSDIAIVWLDIWDIQSENKAKRLINYYFNIENYIATIRGTNINPSIP